MSDTMHTPGGHVKVARVLHEDDAFLTLEVVKDEARQLRVQDGDRFYTIMFIRKVPGSKPANPQMEGWVPWES